MCLKRPAPLPSPAVVMDPGTSHIAVRVSGEQLRAVSRIGRCIAKCAKAISRSSSSGPPPPAAHELELAPAPRQGPDDALPGAPVDFFVDCVEVKWYSPSLELTLLAEHAGSDGPHRSCLLIVTMNMLNLTHESQARTATSQFRSPTGL